MPAISAHVAGLAGFDGERSAHTARCPVDFWHLVSELPCAFFKGRHVQRYHAAMTEGFFALAGVVIGAVLGIAGTALTERWRHSYIRNDARADRYAATMREALDAYTEFVLAWSPVLNQIAKGETLDALDPSIIAGLPGQTHRRLTAVIERIHIESIRHRLGELVDTVVGAAVTGSPVTAASVDAFNELGTNVAADIGAELRKLEAQ